MIRPATLADIPAMVELGRAMVAESPNWSRFTYAPEKVAFFIQALIEQERGFAWVGVRKGEVVGSALAFFDEHWACTDLMAYEMTLYVSPRARGTSIAARLVCAMIEWGYENKVRLIGVGTTTGVNAELTAKLYERFGFERSGFSLELDVWASMQQQPKQQLQ